MILNIKPTMNTYLSNIDILIHLSLRIFTLFNSLESF